MEIVTGHRGTPHITPYKVRDFNIGIVGAEDYVINSGSELEAQLVSNNRIDIKDGSICMQGTHAVIPKNINDELTIENGMQGEKRIDLIVARYEKVADSGVESVNTVVLQGTPSKETPNVPGHVVGDIRNGDLKHEMPLYEVELDGINITEVRPVFKKLVSVAEQQKMIESLNGKLENTFEEYSISPYTYTIYKFNHGNQKFAKIHGTWTGSLGGSLLNGFYQSSITNLCVLNSELGLQIKRMIAQSFYFTGSGGALIFVGLTSLSIGANSINGTIQFLKSQQSNTCRLEWDIEVELL